VAQRTTSTKTKTGRPKMKGASHKTKSSTAKASSARQPRKAGDAEVTIDRRRASRGEAATEPAAAPRLERRQKVNRRRQIDPTTCERDYTDDEIQFMNALEQYKRTSGRMFPTCSEVLEVVRSLGYVKLSTAELAAHNADETAAMNVAANLAAAANEVASAEAWQ
jgi:hypothetical protein